MHFILIELYGPITETRYRARPRNSFVETQYKKKTFWKGHVQKMHLVFKICRGIFLFSNFGGVGWGGVM